MSDEHDELNQRLDEYFQRKAKYEHPSKVLIDGKDVYNSEDDPDFQQWQFEQSMNIYTPLDADERTPPDDDPPTLENAGGG